MLKLYIFHKDRYLYCIICYLTEYPVFKSTVKIRIIQIYVAYNSYFQPWKLTRLYCIF